MLGAIAEGRTSVSGFLEGEDALATLSAFRAMGVEISDPQSGRLTIEGVGLRGLQAPSETLDLGNSGTSSSSISIIDLLFVVCGGDRHDARRRRK